MKDKWARADNADELDFPVRPLKKICRNGEAQLRAAQ
jgi:hypothetical protein